MTQILGHFFASISQRSIKISLCMHHVNFFGIVALNTKYKIKIGFKCMHHVDFFDTFLHMCTPLSTNQQFEIVALNTKSKSVLNLCTMSISLRPIKKLLTNAHTPFFFFINTQVFTHDKKL